MQLPVDMISGVVRRRHGTRSVLIWAQLQITRRARHLKTTIFQPSRGTIRLGTSGTSTSTHCAFSSRWITSELHVARHVENCTTLLKCGAIPSVRSSTVRRMRVRSPRRRSLRHSHIGAVLIGSTASEHAGGDSKMPPHRRRGLEPHWGEDAANRMRRRA
jgi:hypothetical protein